MDKRYKPLSPSEQLAARQAMYDRIEQNPGMSLSETLKLIYESLHLTTKDLSRISKVSERFITNINNDKGNPSLKTVEKLLRPFGLSMGVVRKKG